MVFVGNVIKKCCTVSQEMAAQKLKTAKGDRGIAFTQSAMIFQHCRTLVAIGSWKLKVKCSKMEQAMSTSPHEVARKTNRRSSFFNQPSSAHMTCTSRSHNAKVPSSCNYIFSCLKNAIQILCWFACALHPEKFKFFGVLTAVWLPLLLFSGAHFCREPSNTSP